MSVRKRAWTTRQGAGKEAWVVDYADQVGVRRLKTFARKKDADAFASTADVEIRAGTHVADSDSKTVKEAGELWLQNAEAQGRERSTIGQYTQHLNYHIAPFIGSTLLSKLNPPTVRSFEDRLRLDGRSPAMVRKVMVSLSSILADAHERGLVAHNAVRDMGRRRKRGAKAQGEKRQKGRIEVGRDIPTRAEIKAIVQAAAGRWRPLLITATFTGLRASELRGLRWKDVDFEAGQIHVRQRADRFNAIGKPKSDAGWRSVPMTPMVTNALKEWKRSCPAGQAGLVFPNGSGNVESLANIINRGLVPTQVVAGVTVDSGKVDEEGRAIVNGKYTGMHALRHWFASWCINRKKEGGLELPAKLVQERLGHSSIVMTMDVYGHLFPRGNDSEELAVAEKALFG